jgi:ssDNA-binding Zn-finger/Zn-ribbon topoisomerase 1
VKDVLIRKSSHYFQRDSNVSKIETLESFLLEYRKHLRDIIDYLWNANFIWHSKDKLGNIKERILDIKNDLLDCPIFISTTFLTNSKLSQRALKCAATQACSIIKGAIKHRSKLLYVRNKLISENKDISKIDSLLKEANISKPIINSQTPAELNSICATYKETSSHFNGFIQLMSLGKSFGKLRLPIKYTKHSNKLKDKRNGELMASFLIYNQKCDFRWAIPKPILKENGRIVGADPGQTTVLTLSDGQSTQVDCHGHDLKIICNKLSRKKKGSLAFSKAQEHRKNYINWSINRLNFDSIREVRIESNKNIRRGKKTSRSLEHYTYTLTNRKMETLLEDIGVRLSFNKSFYRSQRCCECSFVYNLNRKGKEFCCKNCGFKSDADLNAAINNEVNLFDLSKLYPLDNKISGFFWKESGVYNLEGKEFTVPSMKEKLIK